MKVNIDKWTNTLIKWKYILIKWKYWARNQNILW